MASRLHARSGLLCPAFLGLILYSSCSVVKEDRTYIGFVSKSKIFSAYRSELKELSQD